MSTTYANLYRPGPAYTIYDEAVDYELDVPLDYWRPGVSIVPPGTSRRVNQLREYQDLFDGNYARYGDFTVRMNWHAEYAKAVLRTIMAYPPEVEVTRYLNKNFIQSLLEALRTVIINLSRFGTALFHVMPTESGPLVYAPSPIYWYPATHHASVLVNLISVWDASSIGHKLQAQLYVYHEEGQVELRLHELNGGILGKRLSSEVIDDDVAGYEVIQQNFLGRRGALVPVKVQPVTGDWGFPLYRDLTSPALEFVRRQTQISQILTEHGNPSIYLVAREGESPPDPGDLDRHSVIAAMELALRYDTIRKANVWVLPGWAQAAEYMQLDSDLTGHFMMLEETQKLIFAVTSMPAAFYGLGIEAKPMSGVALDKQFIRTYDKILSRINALIYAVSQVKTVAAKMAGASAAALQGVANEQVVWRNRFDEDRQRTQVKLGAKQALTEDADARGEEVES